MTDRLTGKHILITAGPTYEPIDPVRYIANRSSGKQGYAIAHAAAQAGARVTLISGPAALPDPPDVKTIRVESAQEMMEAANAALPADIAIFTAAVADWRPVQTSQQKLKKNQSRQPITITLEENPDILKTIATLPAGKRPALVIGFAAETQNLLKNARAKRKRKHCDWIIANNVSAENAIMGGDENEIYLITDKADDHWPRMSKQDVAKKLIALLGSGLKTIQTPGETL